MQPTVHFGGSESQGYARPAIEVHAPKKAQVASSSKGAKLLSTGFIVQRASLELNRGRQSASDLLLLPTAYSGGGRPPKAEVLHMVMTWNVEGPLGMSCETAPYLALESKGSAAERFAQACEHHTSSSTLNKHEKPSKL